MADYVDGFVMPIPKRNIAVYRRMSRKAGRIWREYGAFDYTECIADDVKPGKMPFDGKRMIYGGFKVMVNV